MGNIANRALGRVMAWRLRLLLVGLLMSVEMRASAEEQGRPDQLVFSVRTWEGEYSTRDIPGGVESTPVTSAAIYTVQVDGTGLTQIASPGKNADAPRFTPDGQWIYFQSNATGAHRIYRVSASAGPDDKSQVVIDPTRIDPQFSQAYGNSFGRDGRLLFAVAGNDGARIGLANQDGSEPRLIAPNLGYLYMTALSPSGDAIVSSGPASGYRLRLIRLADESAIDLTPLHPDSYAPQFTPDGRTIIFVRRDGDVYRVDTDGTNLRRLTEGNRYVEFRLSPRDAHGSTDGPEISPDGTMVGYIALRDGVPAVCLMNVDGSEQRTVVSRKTPCGRFRWSPDGTRIAFVSFVGRYPQLFIANRDGTGIRQVTDVEGAVGFPQWRPASR